MKQIREERKHPPGKAFVVEHQFTSTPKNSYSPPHVHDFIEILYCFNGNYHVFLDGRHGTFGKGDMVVINSRQVHETYPIDDLNGDYLVVKFRPEMIYSLYTSEKELQYVLPFLYRSEEREQIMRPEELRPVFESIAREFAEKRYGYEIAMKEYIFHIILWLIRRMKLDSSLPDAYTEGTINKIIAALDYIENHYAENLTVELIAKECFMEYTYFSRIFKEITKKSCTEYINYFRVRKAEGFLLNGKVSITEIASRVGFDNASYFSKQFRKIKGLSPIQYRKKLQERNVKVME